MIEKRKVTRDQKGTPISLRQGYSNIPLLVAAPPVDVRCSSLVQSSASRWRRSKVKEWREIELNWKESSFRII